MMNNSIVICDKKYDIGTPVVLWNEPNGFSAYDTTVYETENRKTGKIEVVKGKRYKSRLALGGTPDFEKLKKVVWQLAFHHSGLFNAQSTYETLQQRGLSCTFLLDDNGVLFQTLDIRERAYHIGKNNAMSIGVEIASRALAGKYPDAYDKAHQEKYKVGPRRVVFDTIHGIKIKGYDYSDAQYATLIKLAKGLVSIFPLIKPDFARDVNGNVIKTVLTNPQQYQGFITHFQCTKSKIDPISFDYDRFLLGVNGTVISQPIENSKTAILPLDGWLGRQKALKALGYDPGIIDGQFGSKTKEALRAFQKDQDLTPDGIWGSKTESAMRQALEQ